jgi:hypothetical protein
MKVILSSTTEAELGAVFFDAKDGITICFILCIVIHQNRADRWNSEQRENTVLNVLSKTADLIETSANLAYIMGCHDTLDILNYYQNN